jgi:hypothetical protein
VSNLTMDDITQSLRRMHIALDAASEIVQQLEGRNLKGLFGEMISVDANESMMLALKERNGAMRVIVIDEDDGGTTFSECDRRRKLAVLGAIRPLANEIDRRLKVMADEAESAVATLRQNSTANA